MTATVTELEILEAMDFHERRTCDHPEHEDVKTLHADGGEMFVRYVCEKCGPRPVAIRCGQYLRRIFKFTVECGECKHKTNRPQFDIIGPANDVP